MKSKIAGIFITLLVAFTILLVSVLNSATVNHAYESTSLAYSPIVLSEKTTSEKTASEKVLTVDYLLAYPGKIRPDNPLWYAKVVRDKAWLGVTFNSSKKAELNLLFSDKRLNSSLELFKDNKPDLGLSTLTKSTKYLEKSEVLVGDDMDLSKKIILSTLKHIEVVETEILPITPEDLRPEVIKVNNNLTEVYKKIRDKMLSKGIVPPDNPFETK